MKVGNLVGGLEVVDVKRVNKLNLIQFLKEVDNYLQEGYRIDVNSARQVGLVLQTDVFKTEEPFSQKAGSTSSVEPKVETVTPDAPKETETTVEEIKTGVEQETEYSVKDVSAENTLVEPTEPTETENVPVEPTSVEDAPIEPEKPTKKPITSRSKKSS